MELEESLNKNKLKMFALMIHDDLAQQVLMKVWLNIRQLKRASAFNAWLKRLAVNVWFHYLRKNDALRGASEIQDSERPSHETPAVGMDLDRALTELSPHVRTCVVLSYNEGMSHREIAKATGMPLGTVKTHIRKGAQQLQETLSAYGSGEEVATS